MCKFDTLFCKWIRCDSEIVSNAKDNVFKKSRRVQASKFTIFFKFPFELSKGHICHSLAIMCKFVTLLQVNSLWFWNFSNATTMYLKSLEGFKRQNSQYSSNFHSNYRRPHLHSLVIMCTFDHSFASEFAVILKLFLMQRQCI